MKFAKLSAGLCLGLAALAVFWGLHSYEASSINPVQQVMDPAKTLEDLAEQDHETFPIRGPQSHNEPPTCMHGCSDCALPLTTTPNSSLARSITQAPVLQALEKLDGTNLPWSTFTPLWSAKSGDRLTWKLAHFELPGIVDSITLQPEVSHLGFRLADGQGRLALSARNDGRVSGYLGFEGESTVLTFTNVENRKEVSMARAALDQVVCAKPNAAYRLPPLLENEAVKLANSPDKGAVGATPAFSSLPNSEYVIFCDFDGEVVNSPNWSDQPINAAPDLKFNDTAWVERVWKRVAEDYIPFDINVTTDPAKFEATPIEKRVHCIITPTTNWYAGARDDVGGVAKTSTFGMDIPCWAFSGLEYEVAKAISHEVGHTLGLNHHGQGTEEYYRGHGTGETAWGPIMGSTFFRNVTQWSNGEYTNATNPGQDDLAVITAGGISVRVDDAGNTPGTASPTTILANSFAQSGVIERTADSDWYQFTTTGGPVTIDVDVLDVGTPGTLKGPNLAVDIRLLKADGTTLVTSSAPISTLGASVSANLSPDTYYLEVKGAGRGTADANFTAYGSLGQYSISGMVPSPGRLQVLRRDNGVEVPSGSQVQAETNFGTPLTGQSLDVAYLVRNVGSLPLQFVGTTISPGQFQASTVAPQALAPGQEVELTVTYQPNVAGTHSALVSIDSDDPDRDPYTFVVNGSAVLDSPDLVVVRNGTTIPAGNQGLPETGFGVTAVGRSSTSANYKVQNTGTLPLVLQSVTSDSVDFSVTSQSPQSIMPGEEAFFTVTFSPTLPGLRSATITLRSNDADQDPFTFGVQGGAFRDDPDIKVYMFDRIIPNGGTANYYFRPTPIGQNVFGFNTSFIIDSSGTQPLEIISVEKDSGDIGFSSVEPQLLSPGDFTEVFLSFSPTESGIRSTQVTIRSNDPNEDPYIFNITGRGQEPGPQLIVTALDYDDTFRYVDVPSGSLGQIETTFTEQLVGSTATVTVQLVNTGDEELQISSMSDDSSQFSVDPVSQQIAPGNSHWVDITFQPTSAGTHTSQITVQSNDLDDYPYMFTVTGTAVATQTDTAPPRIRLDVATRTHILGFSYVDPGAIATDLIDGSLPVVDNSDQVNVFVAGTNLVTFTATDSAGNSATTTRVVIVIDGDTDNDGIPNSWEVANGLSVSSANGADGPAADNDGDGFNNLDEFLADTHPWDPTDLLSLAAIEVEAGYEILFRAKPTRIYSIESVVDLSLNPNWMFIPGLTSIPGAPDADGFMRVLQPSATGQLQFYRVRAELP